MHFTSQVVCLTESFFDVLCVFVFLSCEMIESDIYYCGFPLSRVRLYFVEVGMTSS